MPKAAARPSARHRLLLILSVLAVVLVGFFALGRLSIDFLPSLDAPRLRVQVSVPGVTAAVIEEKVTHRLEEALTGTTDVARIESTTTSGNAIIDLYLKHHRDADTAQQDVAARLERVKSLLPPALESPVVSRIDASFMVAELAVTVRQHDPLALRDWVEGELAKRLRELSGVSAVEVKGGVAREILVMPDQRRLAGFGLGFDDVIQAIQKGRDADTRVAAPPTAVRARREPMQSGNVAAVAAMPVMLPSGESVALSEIAKVTLVEEARSDRFRFNGEEAVKVIVQKQPRAARAEVADRIQTHIEWMRANRLIPEGIEIHPLSRRLDEAKRSLKQITAALVGGAGLVLLAAYLLLGSGRRTLILGVIIAASVQAAFVLMALSGLVLDVMALGGLALGAGLWGASAMLMFENTRLAAHSSNAVNPVMAVAVVIPAALAPFLFIGGEMEALFGEFVVVFSGAWIVSALLALAVVPAFDARRRYQQPWKLVVSQAMVRVRHSYGGLLRRILRRPYPVLVLALTLVGAMTAVLFAKSREIQTLADGKPNQEIVLRVQGPDAGRLAVIGDDIVHRLRLLPGLRAVRHSAQTAREEFALRLDETRAREPGIDVTAAGRALAIALTGIPVGDIRDAEHRYDIRMRLPPEESANEAALGRILLLGELNNRPAVHLRDVATVERITAPAQIRHDNGVPTIELTAIPAADSPPSQAMAQVREALQDYALPAGYRLSSDGTEKATEIRNQGMTLLGLALLLIWATQALLQRSLRSATLVTLTGLMALAGVGAVLLIFNIPLSPPVWLGAAMLIGIAAAHAVLLVTHLEAQREKGPVSHQTIMPAAKHLLRPLLTATLMAQVGMLSLMLIKGGAALLHPLVITVASGLLFSLLANLLLAPLLYFLTTRAEQSPVKPRL